MRNSKITKTIEKSLLKKQIKLEKTTYMKKDEYPDFLITRIDSVCPNATMPFVTFDYYIEKIMLPDKGIYNLGKGDYDMGNGKQEPRNMSRRHLINEINESLIPHSNSTKNEDKNTEKGIYEKLFGKLSKGGLKEQFESVSNISLSSFNDQKNLIFIWKILLKKSCRLHHM